MKISGAQVQLLIGVLKDTICYGFSSDTNASDLTLRREQRRELHAELINQQGNDLKEFGQLEELLIKYEEKS